MNVSRSGYYKWMINRDNINIYERNREILQELILDIHKQKPSFGYHRIANQVLISTGWIVSHNLVHKCCKYLGVKSKARKYKYKKPGHEHLVFPNIIRGDWETTAPLQKIVSDMTCIYHKGKKYDLTFYLDIFNNEILSYSMSGKNGNPNTYYKGLKILLKKIEGQSQETILHTDQGTVYSSRMFADIHKHYTIKRSMSRVGTPTDNPVIESINGWIKAEMELDFDMKNTSNIYQFIDKYIYYYNYERPSYKLNYKTPIQYRIESGFV